MWEIPFMAAAVPVGMPRQINRTRLIEAVITAMVSGAMISAMGYYLAFPVLQEQVNQIKREVVDTREILKEYRREREVITMKRDAQHAAAEAKIVQLQIELAKKQR